MDKINMRNELIQDLDRIIGSCKNLTELNNLKVIVDQRFDFFLNHFTQMEEINQNVKINFTGIEEIHNEIEKRWGEHKEDGEEDVGLGVGCD